MPVTADDPLVKITTNLYRADVAALKRLYGPGWSVKLRELVRKQLAAKQTAGDFLAKLGYGEEPFDGRE